jgi:hypothetical protein
MLPSSNLRRCGWGWAACKRKHSFAEFTAQEARRPPPAARCPPAALAAVNSWAGDAERTFPMPWQRCARVHSFAMHSFAMRAPITVRAVLTNVRACEESPEGYGLADLPSVSHSADAPRPRRRNWRALTPLHRVTLRVGVRLLDADCRLRSRACDGDTRGSAGLRAGAERRVRGSHGCSHDRGNCELTSEFALRVPRASGGGPRGLCVVAPARNSAR